MIAAYGVGAVRAAEEILFAQLPQGALMQRAATGLAVECIRLMKALRGQVVGSRVVLLVGSGNNGGDALWAGAMLRARGCRVDALCVGSAVHGEGALALVRAGGRLYRVAGALDQDLLALLGEADLVLDGILGIGGRGALRGTSVQIAEALADTSGIVVAVDVPSGVDADTGEIAGVAIEADITVTFGCWKPGLLLAPGKDNAGAVVLVDIGLEAALADGQGAAAMSVEGIDAAAFVLEPSGADYKYSRGVAGISAGSLHYPGAALLCTSAAQAAGPGMVRYLDRGDGLAHIVVEHFPDVVLDGNAPARQARASAWGCGPGLVGDAGDEPTVMAILDALTPVVLDAGALQVLADSEAVRSRVVERQKRGLVTVLTPHEGEFRRIAPGVLETSPGRLAAASQAARNLCAIVVLKGPGTVIAAPDGQARIDHEGTADLGAAGSGDILTGVITTLLAHWSKSGHVELAVDVVATAVWLHGRAGRIAATAGPVSAVDIANAVKPAVQSARFGGQGAHDEQ